MSEELDDTMESLQTQSNYHFSAVKVDELGATEYTLVSVVQDASGSVHPFAKDMEACLKTILGACQKSPRAENLMSRLGVFNNNLEEIHGFKLLSSIAVSDYDDILDPDGGTALFDAVQSSVEATTEYAKILSDQEYGVNAIVFVITDGDDNASRATPTSVKKAISDAIKSEALDGITVVLIGVGTDDQMIVDFLEDFQKKAGITQFINVGDATPSKLAKLANFISQSISSTSQALANGTSSSLLSF